MTRSLRDILRDTFAKLLNQIIMELTESIAARLIIRNLLQDFPSGTFIKSIVANEFPDEYDKSHKLRRIIVDKLLKYELAEPAADPTNFSVLRLTLFGNETLSKMTLEEYETNKKRQDEKKAQFDQLSHEKLLIDLKNAKRVYKTYWLTFAIALSGLIISVVLLILRITNK